LRGRAGRGVGVGAEALNSAATASASAASQARDIEPPPPPLPPVAGGVGVVGGVVTGAGATTKDWLVKVTVPELSVTAKLTTTVPAPANRMTAISAFVELLNDATFASTPDSVQA
jgi:hypothetical protein